MGKIASTVLVLVGLLAQTGYFPSMVLALVSRVLAQMNLPCAARN